MDIIKEAEMLIKTLEKDEEYLYENAEIGFELRKTANYVFNRLKEIGLEPKFCGKCGIIATVKGEKGGKSVLLRADMDALTVSDKDGNSKIMHVCGHHMHTAMLLGAAKILTDHKQDIYGDVMLVFQAAEEILEGAKDMIENGMLDEIKPSAAVMLHVMSGVDMPVGTVVVSTGGVIAPAADFFDIEIEGKGTHGALAHMGIDPISVSAYVISALHEIKARELAPTDVAALTIGRICGGESANAIPNNVIMQGSLRSFDEEVREKMKQRLGEICESVASAFKASAKVKFTRGCPSLVNDSELSAIAFETLKKLYGANVKKTEDEKSKIMSGGSDDFAYISQKAPSVTVSVCAGNRGEGYEYPLHNPEVRFDKRALAVGTAVYVSIAMSFLEKEKKDATDV